LWKQFPWADDKVGLKNLLRVGLLHLVAFFMTLTLIGSILVTPTRGSIYQYFISTSDWMFIYFLLRHTPKAGLFILLLVGTTAIALMLPDVVLGGRRSLMQRYLIPSYLGIELAVAYLFASQITSPSSKIKHKRLWQYSLAILFSTGIISCAISSQAENWWNKYNDPIPEVARIINKAEDPFLVADDSSLGTLIA
jgi:uncharacterized membrane protein